MGKLISFHPGLPECRPPSMHSFANPNVRCQCGEEEWPEVLEGEQDVFTIDGLTKYVREATGNPELVVAYDTRPLLRLEKPERKWPEDFRGFGSNVRPKNS